MIRSKFLGLIMVLVLAVAVNGCNMSGGNKTRPAPTRPRTQMTKPGKKVKKHQKAKPGVKQGQKSSSSPGGTTQK